MTCDCIKNIEENILKVFNENKRYGKNIVRVEIQKAFTGIELKLRTFSDVYVQLEGQKKIVTSFINHTYCPFCGKPVEVA